MGRVPYRIVLITISVICAVAPSPAAADRLLVPGGAAGLRRATGMPDHIPDSMVLSEAARTWFGAREPVPTDARHAAELLAYLTTSSEPLAPGPWLPLTSATWMRLLEVKTPAEIAPAIVRSRSAMLLYRGLTGIDDRTLAWLDTQPDLLSAILERAAAAFATIGPWLSITGDGIAVPGGRDAADAWRDLVGTSPAEPASFIKGLLEKGNSRIGWMFSAISSLEPARVKFVVGEHGRNIAPLAGTFARIAPQWHMADRAFSRPGFDPPVALMLIRPAADGSLAGSEEFWRALVRGEAPRAAAAGAPLTAAGLMDILFDDPLQARARWELFALGQRMLRAAKPDQQSWAALNAAMRFPAVAFTLERIGELTPGMLQLMTDAAGRITKVDPDGRRGELAAWQAALVTIERAALSGGINRTETESALTSLARLPFNEPRRELTTWFMDVWLNDLLSRPGAPADAEQTLLRTMAGDLGRGGGRDAAEFTWEDLPYTLAAEHRAFVRMEEARQAQHGPTLTDAKTAWNGPGPELAVVCRRLEQAGDDAAISGAAKRVSSALSKNDAPRLLRDRRELADTIVARVLPLIAYAPQHAASDVPALGADVALRHEITIPEGPEARRRRPWQLAVQVAFEGRPWHLAGSLLSLDVPLAGWYLRTNGEAPMGAPMIEDADVSSMALTSVFGSTQEIDGVARSLGAIGAGRDRVAASPDVPSADALLASRGIDPWRRRAVVLDAPSPGEVARRLTPSEAWRVGLEQPVAAVPAVALDGCPCLGEIPFEPTTLEGRPSNGLVGAMVPGLALRIVQFLKDRGLPLALYRPLAGGMAFDLIHSAVGLRTDDLLALDVAAARITDARLEDHVLALIADGTLAAPSSEAVR